MKASIQHLQDLMSGVTIGKNEEIVPNPSKKE